MIQLAIVSPCYNEEEVLDHSAERLSALFDDLISKNKISDNSFILYVNDGSKDRTWEKIIALHEHSTRFKGLNLAHNVGHQNAIMAGMMQAKDMADAVVTIDADLQDDINCIEKMVDSYEEGYDVVYGVKVERDADPLMKRLTALAFYKLQKMMKVESVYNHADFRLVSRRVLNALSQYSERNLYLRGLIPLIGFDHTTVEETISERQAGKSKYTLSKMIGLAVDGITSFSVKPIYYVMYVGIAFVFFSILIGIYVLYSIFAGTAEHGWASIILSIWLVGGVIILCIGGVGIYIGKIFLEIKRRPLYNIKDFLD
jgi:glycosyltransferase involved in cell wall biosynthesis